MLPVLRPEGIEGELPAQSCLIVCRRVERSHIYLRVAENQLRLRVVEKFGKAGKIDGVDDDSFKGIVELSGESGDIEGGDIILRLKIEIGGKSLRQTRCQQDTSLRAKTETSAIVQLPIGDIDAGNRGVEARELQAYLYGVLRRGEIDALVKGQQSGLGIIGSVVTAGPLVVSVVESFRKIYLRSSKLHPSYH